MNSITSFLSDLTVLFGVVATLAVLVTGFFVGRAWMRGAGDGAMPGERDQASKHWRKS